MRTSAIIVLAVLLVSASVAEATTGLQDKRTAPRGYLTSPLGAVPSLRAALVPATPRSDIRVLAARYSSASTGRAITLGMVSDPVPYLATADR